MNVLQESKFFSLRIDLIEGDGEYENGRFAFSASISIYHKLTLP